MRFRALTSCTTSGAMLLLESAMCSPQKGWFPFLLQAASSDASSQSRSDWTPGDAGGARSQYDAKPGSIASTYWRAERSDRKNLLSVVDERWAICRLGVHSLSLLAEVLLATCSLLCICGMLTHRGCLDTGLSTWRWITTRMILAHWMRRTPKRRSACL